MRDFLNQIDWYENPGMKFRCACDGNYHVHLYRGDELLVSLGLHHGDSVRWRDSTWDTDVELTESSRQAIANWFDSRGYDGVRLMTNDQEAWIEQVLALDERGRAGGVMDQVSRE